MYAHMYVNTHIIAGPRLRNNICADKNVQLYWPAPISTKHAGHIIKVVKEPACLHSFLTSNNLFKETSHLQRLSDRDTVLSKMAEKKKHLKP